MAQAYELKAAVRDRVGKGAARALRREGLIPAVIYGNKEAALPISISQNETTKKLHAGGFLTHVATIDVDGAKIQVIPRDYQLDPVKDTLVHVDFLRIGAGSTIVVDLPVHFVNAEAAPGIKAGGVLNIVAHTVEVEVSANDIPEAINVDLTGLAVGDSIHMSNVKLPAGVKAASGEDVTIATIAVPDVDEDAAAAATEAEAPKK